jgi:hypothetical protein
MIARRLLLAAALAWPCLALAGPPVAHQFGVIGHSFATNADEAPLRQALLATGDTAYAFVVATGIKHVDDACSDALYLARRELFAEAPRPLVLVPAASDWSVCTTPAGRSAAQERLTRLRELFFDEAASLGARKLSLARLSSTSKFRSFAEYAQWEVGNVLYATMNVTSDNNHFRPEAGRNSEFEDRLVANRAWLHRLATYAQRKKLAAIVLFSEGDIGVQAADTKAAKSAKGQAAPLPNSRQDGFADVRRQVTAIALKFPGKVLLVDSAPLAEGSAPAIAWHGNLGHLSLGSHVVEVKVAPGTSTLFSIKPAE